MTAKMPTEYLDNKIDLAPGRPYGAILGLSPSKGARSPVLWRAAFEALGIEADFHPFDVSPDQLPNLIQALSDDPRFIGGACAVPYKEQLVSILHDIEPEAKDIGAINAFYRTSGGELKGANTDGEGGLEALRDLTPDLSGKIVLVMGLGGAGKALATYVAHAGAVLRVWNRTNSKAKACVQMLSVNGRTVSSVSSLNHAALCDVDVLINCTSIGFSADGCENEDIPCHPDVLDFLPESAIVYDIVYQPLKTQLLKAAEERGLKTLNGKSMNQKQAVIAFCKAVKQANPVIVEAAMINA